MKIKHRYIFKFLLLPGGLKDMSKCVLFPPPDLKECHEKYLNNSQLFFVKLLNNFTSRFFGSCQMGQLNFVVSFL